MRLILQQKKSERCQSCVFCVNFRNIVHAVIKRNISKKKKKKERKTKKNLTRWLNIITAVKVYGLVLNKE